MGEKNDTCIHVKHSVAEKLNLTVEFQSGLSSYECSDYDIGAGQRLLPLFLRGRVAGEEGLFGERDDTIHIDSLVSGEREELPRIRDHGVLFQAASLSKLKQNKINIETTNIATVPFPRNCST